MEGRKESLVIKDANKSTMRRLQVSEKTLELNVCAELLYLIRSLQGCQQTFWFGMKQDQEFRNGIDELMLNMPEGRHLALQFKAPWGTRPNQSPYRFTINDRQNRNLLRLSYNKPDSVFYILPHYNTFTKICSHSPVLLQDTYLLKVEDLRSLHTDQNQQGTHKIETEPPLAYIYSDPFEVKLANLSETLGSLLSSEKDQLAKQLISHESLKAWFRELIEEEEGNKLRIGQRLRGFSTFCIG